MSSLFDRHNSENSQHNRIWMVFLAMAALVVAAYYPALFGDFVSDDSVYVKNNLALQSIPTSELWRFFTEITNPFEYLPLRDLSYKFDYSLFGLNPFGYKVHNILLYLATCFVLWIAIRTTLRSLVGACADDSSPDQIALIATLLFALHPAHTESVAWISGRKELLSAFFLFLAWHFFVLGAAKPRGDWKLVLLASSLFAAALLSKITTIVFPVLAFFLAMSVRSQTYSLFLRARDSFLFTCPLFLIALIHLFIFIKISSATGISLDQKEIPDFISQNLIENGLRISGHFAHILVAPINLRLTYNIWDSAWPDTLIIIQGLTLIFVFFSSTVLLVRRPTATALGLIIIGIFIIPFLQILPFKTWSAVSERFLFLSTAGLALVLAAALLKLPKPWRYAMLTIIAILSTAIIFDRSHDWISNESLVRSNAYSSPDSAIAQSMYIKVLIGKGSFETAREHAKAISNKSMREYELAYVEAKEGIARKDLNRIKPAILILLEKAEPIQTQFRYSKPLRIAANLALEHGLYLRANDAFQKIIESNPQWKEIRYNQGLSQYKAGNYLAAIGLFEEAIDSTRLGSKHSAIAWNYIGLSQRGMGNSQAAIDAFNTALELHSSEWQAAYNLANLLAREGRFDAAFKNLNLALIRVKDRANERDAINAALVSLEKLRNKSLNTDGKNPN